MIMEAVARCWDGYEGWKNMIEWLWGLEWGFMIIMKMRKGMLRWLWTYRMIS